MDHQNKNFSKDILENDFGINPVCDTFQFLSVQENAITIKMNFIYEHILYVVIKHSLQDHASIARLHLER